MRVYHLLAALALLCPSGSAWSQTLSIHHLDVGTGDATLFVMPNGNTLLVDAGLDGAAARVIGPFLRSLGITSLDAFVLTHYDSDHMGGVDKLVESQHENIQVSEFFDRDEWDSLPPSKRNGTQFSQYEAAVGTPGDFARSSRR